MTHTSFSSRRGPAARFATIAALLMAVAVGCGSSTPTPAATPTGGPSPTTGNPVAASQSATPSAAPSAAATPAISIVPVPATTPATPTTYAAHLDDATAATLKAALDSARASGKYPGASAAVIFPDGSMWTGASGTAIVSTHTAMTTSTLFSVGSISKTFISALIGRLVEAGTMSLDDHLSKYVPSFPNAANITLRQLMSHTAGVRDLFDTGSTLGDAVLANRGTAWTAAQVLATIGRPYTAPGQGYHYSNTDYVLLGLAVEKATGKKVAALVRSNFLVPLGMTHTYLQTEETAKGPEAHGYMPTTGTCRSPCDNSAGSMIPYTAEATVAGFAGAYVSTPSDLAIWANALYGGYVIDPASLAAMTDITPSMAFKVKPKYPYGLGFEEISLAGQVAFGHRGRLDGFWSAMEYLPASHVTVVFLTNADWATPRILTITGALATAAERGA